MSDFKKSGSCKIDDIPGIRVEWLLLQSPSGKLIERSVVRRPDAVAVVAPYNGTILFIRQYRAALEKEIFELPAGKMDPGESVIVAGNRELIEETGYEADYYDFLSSFYASPGYSDEVIHVLLGHGLKYVGKDLQGEEEHFSEVVPIPIENIERMIEEGKIMDGKTIIGLLHALPVLKG